MAVQVRPLECGWITSDAGGMVTGQTGTMRMPIPSFLIEHPRGTLVFDTGLHPELITTTKRLRSTADLFEIECSDASLLPSRLGELGIAAADIQFAALSHFHFDHAGGLVGLPNARVLAQQAEWDAAFEPGLVEFGVFNPDDFDLGHDRELLDGEHDVFGDGSVRLIPTPGHTAGHQSLLIEDRILLVGDACYCRLALDLDALPPFGASLGRQRETFGWLRAREADGVRLVFSHDTDQWNSLAPFI